MEQVRNAGMRFRRFLGWEMEMKINQGHPEELSNQGFILQRGLLQILKSHNLGILHLLVG